MRRLRRLIRRFLQRPGSHWVLAGLGAGLLLLLPAYAAASGGHGGELHINWWTWDAHAPPVGWFIVDFVLFVWLIVHFTKKPIRAAFLARHERIKAAIRDAAAAHESAKARYEDYKGKLANVEQEAAQFVATGRREGELEKSQIVLGARDYADHLRTDSRAVITQEEARAQARLRRAVTQQVLRLTEDKLRRGLSAADHARLIDEGIAQLETGDVPLFIAGRAKGRSERPSAGGVA